MTEQRNDLLGYPAVHLVIIMHVQKTELSSCIFFGKRTLLPILQIIHQSQGSHRDKTL